MCHTHRGQHQLKIYGTSFKVTVSLPGIKQGMPRVSLPTFGIIKDEGDMIVATHGQQAVAHAPGGNHLLLNEDESLVTDARRNVVRALQTGQGCSIALAAILGVWGGGLWQ